MMLDLLQGLLSFILFVFTMFVGSRCWHFFTCKTYNFTDFLKYAGWSMVFTILVHLLGFLWR